MKRPTLVQLVTATLTTAILAVACSNDAPTDPLPPGTWAFGSASAARPLLRDVGRLEGTPAARAATAALGRLEGCERFAWRAPSADLLHRPENVADGLTCDDPFPAAVRAELDGSGAAWVLSGPLGDATGDDPPRWLLRGRAPTIGPTQKLELELPSHLDSGPADLLLPAGNDPTPDLLFSETALVHLRMTMDRALDPSAWLPSGGPADELFGLRGRLFSRAVLNGHWELAVLPPGAEGRLPLVLALGVRSQTAAETAAASLVSELSRVWGLVPRTVRLDGAEASCFPELRLLPGLEPCWRVDERALVIAWNAEALQLARLAPETVTPGASAPSPARLRVELERFGEAETVLARRLHEELRIHTDTNPKTHTGNTYPWRRWQIDGRRVDDQYRYEILLERSPNEEPALSLQKKAPKKGTE